MNIGHNINSVKNNFFKFQSTQSSVQKENKSLTINVKISNLNEKLYKINQYIKNSKAPNNEYIDKPLENKETDNENRDEILQRIKAN